MRRARIQVRPNLNRLSATPRNRKLEPGSSVSDATKLSPEINENEIKFEALDNSITKCETSVPEIVDGEHFTSKLSAVTSENFVDSSSLTERSNINSESESNIGCIIPGNGEVVSPACPSINVSNSDDLCRIKSVLVQETEVIASTVVLSSRSVCNSPIVSEVIDLKSPEHPSECEIRVEDSILPDTPAERSETHSEGEELNLQVATNNDPIDGDGFQAPLSPTKLAKNKVKAKKESVPRRRLYFKGKEPPERSKMTMMDLIYWNPKENPLKPAPKSNRPQAELVTSQHRRNSISCTDIRNTPDVSNGASQEDLPAPRLKIGPDGKITIDEESLVIKQTLPTLSSVVYEDSPTTYSSFREKRVPHRWRKKDTISFYRALSCIGTDFTIMANVLKKWSRLELKRKFKQELKRCPEFIQKTVNQANGLDIKVFELEMDKYAAKSDEEDEFRKPKNNPAKSKKKDKSENSESVSRRQSRQRANVNCAEGEQEEEETLENNDHSQQNVKSTTEVVKKKRGRPKGSKSKNKQSDETNSPLSAVTQVSNLKKTSNSSQVNSEHADGEEVESQQNGTTTESCSNVPKKRGRKPKIRTENQPIDVVSDKISATSETVKKKRGRPKKIQLPVSTDSSLPVITHIAYLKKGTSSNTHENSESSKSTSTEQSRQQENVNCSESDEGNIDEQVRRSETPGESLAKVLKKRGRKPKISSESHVNSEIIGSETGAKPTAKRGRGRPRKSVNSAECSTAEYGVNIVKNMKTYYNTKGKEPQSGDETNTNSRPDDVSNTYGGRLRGRKSKLKYVDQSSDSETESSISGDNYQDDSESNDDDTQALSDDDSQGNGQQLEVNAEKEIVLTVEGSCPKDLVVVSETGELISCEFIPYRDVEFEANENVIHENSDEITVEHDTQSVLLLNGCRWGDENVSSIAFDARGEQVMVKREVMPEYQITNNTGTEGAESSSRVIPDNLAARKRTRRQKPQPKINKLRRNCRTEEKSSDKSAMVDVSQMAEVSESLPVTEIGSYVTVETDLKQKKRKKAEDESDLGNNVKRTPRYLDFTVNPSDCSNSNNNETNIDSTSIEMGYDTNLIIDDPKNLTISTDNSVAQNPEPVNDVSDVADERHSQSSDLISSMDVALPNSECYGATYSKNNQIISTAINQCFALQMSVPTGDQNTSSSAVMVLTRNPAQNDVVHVFTVNNPDLGFPDAGIIKTEKQSTKLPHVGKPDVFHCFNPSRKVCG